MDKTTLLLAGGVFSAVFIGAMWLMPADSHSVTKPAKTPEPVTTLTPKQQAEMEELRTDAYSPNLTPAQKFRLLARQDLIRDYPLAVIDAAEEDGPVGRDSYKVAIATPGDDYFQFDAWRGTQLACVAWRNNSGTIHDGYVFKPGFIAHSGDQPEIGWVRSGCAKAIAENGQVVTHRQMLQQLLDRIPTDNDYAEGRAAVRARLNDRRPLNKEERGVRYWD